MASPVPVPKKDISAEYCVRDRILTLRAKGELPSFILTPSFHREVFAGGLRFSLIAFRTGLGKPKQVPFDVDFKLPILLPMDHFNSKSVTVDTSLGTFDIPIKYDWPGPGPVIPTEEANDATPATTGGHPKEGSIFRDVLPPINLALLADSELPITAIIPKTTGDAKSYVDISFNEEYFKLVKSSVIDGSIRYDLKWAKLPTGEGENPQFIDVTTSIWNGEVGPIAKTSHILQPYIIHFVVLEK
ncbi:hypothetical protein NM208_g2397 [Fusarium decemcellulare]|uniref:Uncharacterized protein n=1 Tax=Fusarium decemcellulare TaxID=57161 RepID=A0ACC1SSV1_9HYPO|nr:hypothetical protein NM208_g2397 [Fusarium decemcellulare]